MDDKITNVKDLCTLMNRKLFNHLEYIGAGADGCLLFYTSLRLHDNKICGAYNIVFALPDGDKTVTNMNLTDDSFAVDILRELKCYRVKEWYV